MKLGELPPCPSPNPPMQYLLLMIHFVYFYVVFAAFAGGGQKMNEMVSHASGHAHSKNRFVKMAYQVVLYQHRLNHQNNIAIAHLYAVLTYNTDCSMVDYCALILTLCPACI